jgi:hypothetical protein
MLEQRLSAAGTFDAIVSKPGAHEGGLGSGRTGSHGASRGQAASLPPSQPTSEAGAAGPSGRRGSSPFGGNGGLPGQPDSALRLREPFAGRCQRAPNRASAQ